MLKNPFAIMLLILALLPCAVTGAETSDVQLEIDISASYHVQENYLQREGLELIDHLHFAEDRSFKLVQLHPSLSFGADKNVYGVFGADITWENPAEEENDELEADVTVAYLGINGGNIRMDLGIQPVQFGNGFIMTDNVLAAAIHMNRGNGYAELKAARAMDSSPMVGLTLGYRPGYFERLEIFGIWFSDQDNIFAYSIPLVYQVLLDLSSEGRLYYFGAAADLFVGDAMLTLVGAYQTGQYTIGYRNMYGSSGEVHAEVRAYFGDISLEQNLSGWCTAGVFCYLASGDDTPSNSDLEAFLSITPYNPRAAIFFDPDFEDNDDAERFTYGGGFFGGVIAPGVKLTLLFEGGLTADASLIYLFAHQALDDGSQWYGWEVDLAIGYAFGEKYRLFVEAARFEHGDYFESLLAERTDPAVRLVAGVHATF